MSSFLWAKKSRLTVLTALWAFLLSPTALWAQCGDFCSELFWRVADPPLLKEWLGRYPKATTARTSSGHYAVHFAALFGRNPQALKVFLGAGAHADATDKSGLTPSFYIIQKNQNPDLLKVFLDAGADADATDPNGSSLLFYTLGLTVAQKGPQLIRVLGDAGANASFQNDQNITPLLHAILSKTEAPLVEALVDIGADTETPYQNGFKAIHFAILEKSPPGVVRAIAKRANLDVLDAGEMSPLHYAVKEKSDPEVVSALLEAGADPNILNGTNTPPLCLAEIHHEKVVPLLKKFGGKC
ncbi:MAG: ankyrin repeat domain-containing protein [Bacteriovoracales bacterium]|nr:ankyrin repeat domain-containing protein [Bacteriovoracales bacterium]